MSTRDWDEFFLWNVAQGRDKWEVSFMMQNLMFKGY